MPDTLRAVFVALMLSGCVGSGEIIETAEGQLRVVYDPELARFSPIDIVEPDGSVTTISPFPAFGALLVSRPAGPPLGLEDGLFVASALQQYCGDESFHELSLRGGSDGVWVGAPCGQL